MTDTSICETDNYRGFKLASDTRFCSFKRKSLTDNIVAYPLVLEHSITFNNCEGLQVIFMGQIFSVSTVTENKYKFRFPKGTIYTLESDAIGLYRSLKHDQDFIVKNGTKIEVPAGTLLISSNKELNISITLNNTMELNIVY